MKNSVKGRRLCLRGTRSALFPLAEDSTFTQFKGRRQIGLRVGPRLLRAMMKVQVREMYGESALAKRWGVSLRRKSKKKPVSAEERLPKLRRWHAIPEKSTEAVVAAAEASTRRFATPPPMMTISDDDDSAQDVGAAAESGTQTVVNMRGKRIDSVVAAQGSHSEGTGRRANPWPEDCGLCALKNLTAEPSFSLKTCLL